MSLDTPVIPPQACIPAGFADDTEVGQQDFVVEASKRRRVLVELKPGGANTEVTPDNLEEYLQLYAEHHLIGAIREQVNAFRQGLGVFLDEALMAKLRACCTVAEFQLMLCGAPEIDVDDWQASTEYLGGYSAGSDPVKWFWAEVRGMTPEERGQLLFFCTGSARAPATGFADLMGMGYNEEGYPEPQPMRFTIECDDRGTERPPTAHMLQQAEAAAVRIRRDAGRQAAAHVLGGGLSRGRCCVKSSSAERLCT